MAAAGEVRTWTAAEGGFTTEAEFVALKPGNVVSLRLKDGKQREIPLDKLSDADRAYAHGLATEKRTPPPSRFRKARLWMKKRRTRL